MAQRTGNDVLLAQGMKEDEWDIDEDAWEGSDSLASTSSQHSKTSIRPDQWLRDTKGYAGYPDLDKGETESKHSCVPDHMMLTEKRMTNVVRLAVTRFFKPLGRIWTHSPIIILSSINLGKTSDRPKLS